jgi:hypothetical protein
MLECEKLEEVGWTAAVSTQHSEIRLSRDSNWQLANGN